MLARLVVIMKYGVQNIEFASHDVLSCLYGGNLHLVAWYVNRIIPKYYAEQAKLVAEAMKYNRDHRLSPWLAVAAISGGIGGTIAGAVAILKLAGILP